MLSDLYVDSFRINHSDNEAESSYLSAIPAIRLISEFHFQKKVTFFVGENGTGKSTLLEALAVCCGFNPEGGSKNFSFSSKETHSSLYRNMKISRGAAFPKDGFFLRAESFYNVATQVDELMLNLSGYGGKSLHEQSHGESFLALVLNRFRGNGLYILDEPEAALSPSRQLSLLTRLHELVGQNSQFIIATHSPILTAYPDAEIYALSDCGAALTPYTQTENYLLTKQFLDAPQRMLHYLFDKSL